MNQDVFPIRDFRLASGNQLSPANIAYRTHGELNTTKTNVVLLCSPVASGLDRYDFLIGAGKALDPSKYFIVSTALFGSGLSSSPSNTLGPHAGSNFPSVSIADNVAAQKLLLEEKLGVSNVYAACGFSMGAQQAFQWAVSYPNNVEKVVAWCGHARTTAYTEIFLDGVTSALRVSPDWNGGNYASPPRAGLKAVSRSYAGWGMSAAWYRENGWQAFGCATKEQYLENVLDEFFYALDANDFLSQLDTWKRHNVGLTAGFEGDHLAALSSVRASTLIMPCVTDLYFPLEDSRSESEAIPDSRFLPIESTWGHWAGFGIDEENAHFINDAIETHLND